MSETKGTNEVKQVGISAEAEPAVASAGDATASAGPGTNPVEQGKGVPPQGGLLRRPFADSELVFGLVGAVGTDLGKVRLVLEDRLKVLGYTVTQVGISDKIIPLALGAESPVWSSEFERINGLMDAGDEARRKSKDNSILALGAAAYINLFRPRSLQTKEPQHDPKRAYIISSLKHPAEVARLRDIYPLGFYLIGVHSDEKRRYNYLTKDKGISDENANTLMKRDADERHADQELKHGQKLIETFHLSDFFVRIDGQDDPLKQSVWRMLHLLFSDPYVTPTFDEYAMFLAYAASLRSADLSRQVGAVVAVEEQVVATGANDCPKAGGGLYWPVPNKLPKEVKADEDGRDYVLGCDPNQVEQKKIIDDILDRAEKEGLDRTKVATALQLSRIHDLTEFGRVVHAEMDALLACGRARIRTKGGTLYTTTFPCHNCAKHIIAAGILRVVFIEPYQKSKAADFHRDSIQVGFADSAERRGNRTMVKFEPFVGVGPRRFFDLFSMKLGSGFPIKRKDKETGKVLEWTSDLVRLRLQMLPASYLDLELVASDMFKQARAKVKENSNG